MQHDNRAVELLNLLNFLEVELFKVYKHYFLATPMSFVRCHNDM